MPEFRATLCSAVPHISVLVAGPCVVVVAKKGKYARRPPVPGGKGVTYGKRKVFLSLES